MNHSAFRRALALSALILASSGCGGVVEDRSINHSTSGDHVAFQHGNDGVFVAGGNGEKLEKIFDTGDETIAVSAPLWSPTDDRLIFATARSADPDVQNANRDGPHWDANPEGRRFYPASIIYTCWLRESPHGDQLETPVVLFEAACDHAGYVAANLAIRWHPDGKKIAFIDQVAEHAVSLFEFELETKQVTRLIDESPTAMIFDWSPGGSHLACVTFDAAAENDFTGITIRSGENPAWWRVPQSGRLATSDSADVLERLRATKPVWTNDEMQFAFVASVINASSPPKEGEETHHAIFIADVAGRAVSPLYEATGIVRDVRWRADAQEIGFIEGASSTLRFVTATGKVSTKDGVADVRKFVGWNAAGNRLAYVSPEPVVESREQWALLFPRIKHARDRVFVADAADPFPGRVVHSGVKVTFPQWSPKENSLSLWGTYAPTHRSWLSQLLPWSLRPGDPAAILDLQTNEMTWMAVSPHEEAQVGHYFLLKKEYETAWAWYIKSADRREPAGSIKLRDLNLFMSRQQIHHDATFFEYICLMKRNRPDEAAEKLKTFRANMTFDTSNAADVFPQSELNNEELHAELEQLADFITPFMQNAFITEVYLSLDMAEEGVKFFRDVMMQTSTDVEQLAEALCLSQLLLATDDRPAYVEVANQELIPILKKLFDGEKMTATVGDWGQGNFREATEQFALYASGGVALLPLMSERFLEPFSDEALIELASRWRELRESTSDETEQFAFDLMLSTVMKRLDEADELTEISQRMVRYRERHPEISIDPAKIDELVESLQNSAQ